MSEYVPHTPNISEELRKFFKFVLGERAGGQLVVLNDGRLKQILGALNRMPYVRECDLKKSQLSVHQRKEQLISTISQILYEDYPACQVVRVSAENNIRAYNVDEAIVRERQQALQAQQQQQPQQTTAATPSAQAVPLPPSVNTGNQANSVPPFNPQTFMQNLYAQQLQNQPTLATLAARLGPSARSPANKKSPVRQKSPPKPATPNKRPVPAALPNASAAKASSPTRNASPPKPKKVKVKSEPKNDDDESTCMVPLHPPAVSLDDSTPHNPRETALTSELLAMGFSDRSEILWSVRKLAQSGTIYNLTSDQVMMDIITNREETDEARKMDEARRQSERTRKQESKRLRHAIAQQQFEERKRATWSEWSSRSDMYARSWILANAGVREKLENTINSNSQVKEALMEVLDLEKKSRKWYGQTLPRAYFRGTLAQRFTSRIEKHSRADSIIAIVKGEITILKEAMFTLSVQQGGVPKLFVDALDSPTMITGDENEEVDEEITVVRIDGGFGPEKGLSTPKSLLRQQVVKRTPEVIEIE